ncbi:GhoT/OrtT family toxin [Enterobacter hormaechei]|nr:GhoT/OrtT family toxin [Enterobacter hormaechei]
MTLYQKMLVFYAIMASICALITWFLSKDRKRIRLLSADESPNDFGKNH